MMTFSRTRRRTGLIATSMTLVALLTTMLMASPAIGQQDEGVERPDRERTRNRDRQDRDSVRGEDRPQRDARRARGGFGAMGRGFGAMRQMMQPQFLNRDMPLISDSLNLDATQRTIVETLLLDYETSFEEAADRMRERFADLMPDDPDRESRREEFREVREQLRDASREMRNVLRQPQDEEDDVAASEARAKVIEEHRARLELLRGQLRDLMPPMPEDHEMQAMREAMGELAKQWRTDRRRLHDAFMSDLRLQLNEKQSALWPDFERELRREKSMRHGRLSGESIDLTNVLRDMNLGEDVREHIEPQVTAYEIAMHEALGHRDDHLESSQSEMIRALMDRDYDAAITLAEREASLRTAVRDVNDRHVVVIGEALGAVGEEAAGRTLRREYRQTAYPRIYRPTVGMRSFDIAESFEDLDENGLITVLALEETYLAELAALNQRLLDITREHEPKRSAARMEWRMARMNGRDMDQPEDPVREAAQKRGELERRYRSQLESVLTREQIERLPELREERERDWRRGRGGDGERDRRREEFRERMIQEFDADGDGELSQSERDAAREQMRERFGDRPGRGRRGGSPV